MGGGVAGLGGLGAGGGGDGFGGGGGGGCGGGGREGGAAVVVLMQISGLLGGHKLPKVGPYCTVLNTLRVTVAGWSITPLGGVVPT